MSSFITSGIDPFGQIYNSLRPKMAQDGHAHRVGDLRFPRSLEKWQLAELEDMGIAPVTAIGDIKMVPMVEFMTERRARIALDRMYYNLEPPTPQLDIEDPGEEMLRIIPGISRKVVNKGAKFLFSSGRFHGSKSFVFPSATASWRDKIWPKFWRDNKMTTTMKRVGRTTLWAGDMFLKFRADILVTTTLEIPNDILSEEVTENKDKEVKVKLIPANPGDFHSVSNPDDPTEILVWVYQFKREDGTFYREEIFDDMTFQYEGKISEDLAQEHKQTLNIRGSGLNTIQISTRTEFIEFKLVNILSYEEFDDFPLVIFRNEPDHESYGTSVYKGLHGDFDSLIDTFTRTHNSNQNQATPLLWAAGVRNDTDHDVHTPDAVWCYENEKATLNVLQWTGTPESTFKFVDLVISEIHQCVGVPRSEELQAFTNISGDALDRINGDIIDTTWDRRDLYEESFEDMVRKVRKAHGIKKPLEEDMETVWGPVFPESKDKIKEHNLALFREEVVDADFVIINDPLIPFHQKAKLATRAMVKQKEREALKKEAIAAQGARVTQRAGGTTAERGKAPKTRNNAGAPPVKKK